jgi:FKBP-type peptidyl-prolyl cis-trans isomerase FkpA
MDFMRNHRPMVVGIILLFVALILINIFNDKNPAVIETHTEIETDAVEAQLEEALAEVQDQIKDINVEVAENMTDEFIIENEVVGEGAEAVNGKTVSVHYTGTFIDGSIFDSSVQRGTPFEFFLGAGQVIKGWDQGVLGMKVGGKRKLTIPPELGYGDNDRGPIPGGSTLIFEVELLGVK